MTDAANSPAGLQAVQRPSWYVRAVEVEPLHQQVEVRGATIAVRQWGPSDGPLFVLVHGGAAHSGWWDHIAPALATTARVVGVDSSGHGDSTRRPEYTLRIWADELCDLVAALSRGAPTTIVGHSRGGMVALLAAPDLPDVRNVVLLETAFGVQPPPVSHRPLRVYGTRAEAVSRFRTIPVEPYLHFVLRHVAEGSVDAVAGGWSWKFDPRTQGRPLLRPEHVGRVDIPVTLVRGSSGLVSAEFADAVRTRLGPLATVTTIQGAGHHIMLSHPLELVEELLRHAPT